MEHIKIYHSRQVRIGDRTIMIEGPVPPDELKRLRMHPGLDAFRQPEDQHRALAEIAGLPEGRIIIARDDDLIVGYASFHYPDELERWSEGKMEDLIELGAIEVARDYRNFGLGKEIIKLAFAGGQMENVIVFTTEYYWHWDLKGSQMNVWQYRKMMENLMKSVDMVWSATDDPEICAHPANCLMVRIGRDVPISSQEKFDRLRFQRRIMY